MTRLDISVAISNALCGLAHTLAARGHLSAERRVLNLRSAIDRAWCRLFGHPRIVFGVMRDICLDCLTIVDEHPQGRAR